LSLPHFGGGPRLGELLFFPSPISGEGLGWGTYIFPLPHFGGGPRVGNLYFSPPPFRGRA